MATERLEDPFSGPDEPIAPCVRCQEPTRGTLFASANVFIGIDASGKRISQWLSPIPVCERHRRDLSRNMSALSWCTTDQCWGMAGHTCVRCGRSLTIRYHRS